MPVNTYLARISECVHGKVDPHVLMWSPDCPGGTSIRIEPPQVNWCQTHDAACHPPPGSELRCDVWVVAGLDGALLSRSCIIVPMFVVDAALGGGEE